MHRRSAVLAALVFFALPSARAAFINPGDLSNPLNLLNADVSDPIIRTAGFATDNKAYEPATPLGTALGVDVGVILTAVNIPASFNQALASAGAPASDTDIHFLPVPEMSLHKGITPFLDVGFQGIWYQTYRVLGGDVKFVVYQPEEGPTWALRLNYASADFKFVDTGVSTELKTYTLKPELVISRELDFADPYLTLGYQYTSGTMGVTLDPSVFYPPLASLHLPVENESARAHGSAFVGGIGLAMRVPSLGLKLTLDAEYQSQGANSMGAKVGFSF